MDNEIKGVISGIGNRATRENEIQSDFVADVRYSIAGLPYGIFEPYTYTSKTAESFSCTKKAPSILHVNAGYAMAYGYAGEHEGQDIDFVIKPPVAQYHIVYLKWDKSVLPNAFFIGVKNNYASKEITEFSLRRDVLSAIKTGVFQLPIAIVKVDKSGISEIIDLRETDSLYPIYQTPLLRNYPYKMEEADEAGGTEENGVLSAGITAETQPEGTNNKTVATTKFGYQEILPEIEK